MIKDSRHIGPYFIELIFNFLRIVGILLLLLFTVQQKDLFAQVITNTGANITISAGTIINTKDIENNTGSVKNHGIINLEGKLDNGGIISNSGVINLLGNLGNDGNILNNGEFNLGSDLNNGITGVLSNEEVINLRGDFVNIGETKGDGQINIAGDWNNTGTYEKGISTVTFNGEENQNVLTGDDSFYNMVISNEGNQNEGNLIILHDNAEVSNTLTLLQGNVNAGSYILSLSNPASGALIYTSTTGSRIIGKFERSISATTGNYLFPLGSIWNYNPANIVLNATPDSGTVLSEFITSDPGEDGLPLEDGPVEIAEVSNDGFWSFTPKNGFAISDYNISLDAGGFEGLLPEATRIIKRTHGADWVVDGGHRHGEGSLFYRDNLTGGISPSGTEFGLGRPRPKISVQPADTAICEGADASFMVQATGYDVKYQWQVNDGSGWSDINNDGLYSGATEDVLLLTGVPYDYNGYLYRVIVTDKYSITASTSREALLTVSRIPDVNSSVSSDTICNDSQINIELTSSVPGTTFTWNVTSVDSISGASAGSGSIIQQTLSNSALSARLVTYEVTPEGPDPTRCQGNSIFIPIWVNPTPRLSVSVPDTVMCDSTTLNITVEDLLGEVRGEKVYYLTTTFTEGAVKGVSESGIYTSGFAQSDTLINQTDSIQVIRYRFQAGIRDDRPGYENNYCDQGTDTTLTIHLNPKPRIFISPSADSLCYDEGISFNVRSGNRGTIGGLVYDVEVEAPPGISNASGGNDLSLDTFEQSDLLNTDTLAHTVLYRFIPRIRNVSGTISECANGEVKEVEIIVNPRPRIIVHPVADTVCFDEGITFTIASGNGNIQGDWRYDAEVTAGSNLDLITGRLEEPVTSSEPGELFQPLVNQDTTVHWIEYTFTPRINNISASGGDCQGGLPQTVRVIINPRPRIIVHPVADTLCFDEGITFTIASGNGNVQGDWRYDAEVSAGSNLDLITGRLEEPVTSSEPGELFQPLVNEDTVVHWIEYTFTPRINNINASGGDCQGGLPQKVRMIINPRPRIIVHPVADTVCFDKGITFTIASGNGNVQGDWRYDAAVTEASDFDMITGSLEQPIEGYEAGELTQSLVNLDTVVHWIEYTFTPRINNISASGGDCQGGLPQKVRVIINPRPRIIVQPVADTLCFDEGITFTIASGNGNVQGDWRYDAAVTDGSDLAMITGSLEQPIEGYEAGELTQSLVNEDTVVHWIEYTFTPRINNISASGGDCQGGLPKKVRMIINPRPHIIVTPIADTLCYNEGMTFTVETGNPTLIGKWIYDVEVDAPPGIINASGGDGLTAEIFEQTTLENTYTSALTVVYRFIPRIINVRGDASECVNGRVREVSVIVNPQPRIVVEYSPDTLLCFDEGISFSVNSGNGLIQGDWVYDVSISNISNPESIEGKGEDVNQPAGTLDQPLLNTSSGYEWIEYTFTPKIRNVRHNKEFCGEGIPDTIRVYINPQPILQVTANPDTIICDDEGVSFSVSTGNTSWIGDMLYDVVFNVSDPAAFENVSGDNDRDLDFNPDIYYQDTVRNISDLLQYIDYSFIPKISLPSGRITCENGIIHTNRVWINPRPRIIVQIPDTIYCDKSGIVFTIESLNGNVFGEKVYDIEITHVPGAVDRVLGNGRYFMDDLDSFKDSLINNTDSLQVIVYTVRPRILNPRGNDPSYSCENSFDTTIILYLNPVPKLNLQPEYDIYCDSSEILIELVHGNPSHTGEKYYYLESSFTGNVSGVLPGGVFYPAGDITDFLINNDMDLQYVTYQLTPVFMNYRHKGNQEYCGSGIGDTATLIINPTPVIDVYLPDEDTLVCNKSTVHFSFSNEQQTTGTVGYRLSTSYQYVNGVRSASDNTLDSFADSLTNISDSIQEIHYTFTPVIYGARPGFDCSKGRVTTRVVKVVPELYTVARTDSFAGNHNIRCYGLTTDLELTIHGGYYLMPYSVYWLKDGEPPDNPYTVNLTDITADPVTLSSTYSVSVQDQVGCSFSSEYIITQPPEMFITTDTIVPETCSASDGQIQVDITGGTPEYAYLWEGVEGFKEITQDIQSLRYGDYSLTLTDANGCELMESYLIERSSPITVTVIDQSRYGNYNIKCNDESNGHIIIELGGGTGDTLSYNYTWIELNTGVVDPSRTAVDRAWNLKAGNYFYEVIDERGCYGSSEEIILAGPERIVVNRTGILQNPPFDITCFGTDDGIINIDVDGGHLETWPEIVTYDWTREGDPSFHQNTRNLSELPAGVYYVTVSDSFGCLETASFTLLQPDEYILDTLDISNYNGYQVSCYGYNNSRLDLNVTGGYGNHEYTWTTTTGALNDPYSLKQENLPAGTYKLTVKDAINCQASWDFEILQPDTLNADPQIVEINDYNISCFEASDGTINLFTSGGVLPYRFDWTTEGGSGIDTGEENQTRLTAGVYNVRIQDANNCTGNWTFGLIQPEKLVLSSEIVPVDCYGFNNGSIDLTVAGGVENYSYLWNTGQISEDLDSLPSGRYYVDIRDANGCHLSDTMIVSESEQILIEFILPLKHNGRMISCHGMDDAEIFAHVKGGYGNYSYRWEDREETGPGLLSNVSAGMYVLHVNDEHGCQQIDTVQVIEPDPVIAELYPVNPSCNGFADGEINLIVYGGTPAYIILETNTEQTGSRITGLTKGEYQIEISDLNNCTLDTFAILTEPDSIKISKILTRPFCPDSYDGIIEITEITGGTAPFMLNWNKGFQGHYLDALREGKYILNVEDFNKCVLIDTTELISINSSCLIIPSAFTPNNDGINDTWEIDNIDLYPDARIEIYNRWGELIFMSVNGYERKWDGTYKGREMPIDSYHYIIHLRRDIPPVTGVVTIIR